MPELPEVETVKRTLNQLVAGKTYRTDDSNLPRILQRPTEPEQFADMLVDRTIQSVERRGQVSTNYCSMVLCLFLICGWKDATAFMNNGEPVERHTHVSVSFHRWY